MQPSGNERRHNRVLLNSAKTDALARNGSDRSRHPGQQAVTWILAKSILGTWTQILQARTNPNEALRSGLPLLLTSLPSPWPVISLGGRRQCQLAACSLKLVHVWTRGSGPFEGMTRLDCGSSFATAVKAPLHGQLARSRCRGREPVVKRAAVARSVRNWMNTRKEVTGSHAGRRSPSFQRSMRRPAI